MTIVERTVYSLGFHGAQFRTGANAAVAQSARLRTSLMGAGQAAQGLQFGMYAAGFAGSIAMASLLKSTSAFEQEALRASQATNEGAKHMDLLGRRSFQTSDRLKKSAVEVAELTKSVNRMGVESVVGAKGFTVLSHSVEKAAAELATVTELNDKFAAESLFRFLLVSSKTDEQYVRNIKNAKGFASALLFAGDSVTAGTEDLVKFMTKLQLIAPLVNVTEAELIALAATMVNLEQKSPDRVTSSLLRLFSDEMIENASGVAKGLGMTAEAMDDMRRNDPMGLLREISEAVHDASQQTGRFAGTTADAASFLHELGFANVRDKRTIAAFTASLRVFDPILKGVNEEIASGNQLQLRLGEQLDTATQRWSGFTAQIERSAIAIGQGLMPVLKPLLGTMEALASIPEHSPVAASLLGLGLMGGVGTLAARSGILGPLVMGGGRGFGGPFGLYFAARRRQRGGGGGGLGGGGIGGGAADAGIALPMSMMAMADIMAMRGAAGRRAQEAFFGQAGPSSFAAGMSREERLFTKRTMQARGAAAFASLGAVPLSMRRNARGQMRGIHGQFLSKSESSRIANVLRGAAIGGGAEAAARIEARRFNVQRFMDTGELRVSGPQFHGPGLPTGAARLAGAGGLTPEDLLFAHLLTPRGLFRGGKMRRLGMQPRPFAGLRTAAPFMFLQRRRGLAHLAAQSVGAGRMRGIGGGMLGALGGRMGLGAARGLASFGAGRAALGALGPLGLIAGSSIAMPFFRNMSQMLDEIRSKGPIVGTVAGMFSTVFKVLELGTNSIGLVTDKILSIVGLLGKIPGVKQVFDFTRDAFGGINDTLDKANAWIDEQRGRGPVRPLEVNVDARTGRDATREQAGQTMKNVVIRRGGASAFQM